MTLPSWIPWLKGTPGRKGRAPHGRPHRRTVTRRRSFVPRLDVLEDRTVPSGLHHDLDIGSLNSPHALVFPNPGNENRAPDLGDCQNLQVPAGNKVAFHVYAEGVQIYRWNGTSWVFVAPEAVLFAGRGGSGAVGTHYAGPTWESVSGSKVVGTVLQRCTPDPNAIPWLLLKAVSSEGPGIFHRVTYIQRVNTVGGLAPAHPGDVPGEVARVPYTAEYFFYRAHP
jgi:Protein of unknown function (DUF3455)